MVLLVLACAADPVAGEERYTLFCASCHGADGAAGVQVSGVAATDLARVIPSLSDSTLLSVMQDGSGAMPPQRLDDADAADLVAYLRQAFGG
jgi:mono/diheme cytochrome c family protein